MLLFSCDIKAAEILHSTYCVCEKCDLAIHFVIKQYKFKLNPDYGIVQYSLAHLFVEWLFCIMYRFLHLVINQYEERVYEMCRCACSANSSNIH